jgi:hypothetical protein
MYVRRDGESKIDWAAITPMPEMNATEQVPDDDPELVAFLEASAPSVVAAPPPPS